MENAVAVVVLLLILGGAVTYLIRAKKSGVKCVGCPAGGSCSGKMKKKKLAGPVIGKKVLQISGMHCQHCVMNVTRMLDQIDGVRAKVDLNKGRAVVSYDRKVDDSVLKNAVEKIGYQVTGISSK